MSRLPPGHEAFARAALPSYGRRPDAPLRLLGLAENATWLIDDDRPLVLRVHRPGYHTREAVESEIDWMAAIRRDTVVRVPEPIPTSDDRHVVSVAVDDMDLLVDAMSFEQGVPADRTPDTIDLERLGWLTALLHEHATGWSRPAAFTRFRWDLDAIVGPAARWGDWRGMPRLAGRERAVIERAQALVAARVSAFGETPDRFGLIHGDLAPANLLVDGVGTITLLDFDDCGWSWFLADIAAVIASFEPQEAACVTEALLRGYVAARPLPVDHVAMISTFVMLRRIQLLAWYASHADSTERPRPDLATATAHLAEGYLTEHTA